MLTSRVHSLGAILALLVSIIYLNFFCGQSHFYEILSAYSVAFVGYFIFLRSLVGEGSVGDLFKIGVATGIVLRVVLIFAFPLLSDDIYRFLWDGHLMHKGVHPLSFLPSDLIKDSTLADGYLRSIYAQLNSPNYFTVYPPISQLVFYLATLSESWSIYVSAGVIKLILLLSDVGILLMLRKLLIRFDVSPRWSLIYFLNPLVITEVSGQIHFESLMVFFLCGTFHALSKGMLRVAGFSLALSIGTKLLPLMFVPLFMKHLNDRVGNSSFLNSFFKFFVPFGAVLLLTFGPFFRSLDLGNFMASLNLYFQSFEFNASLYYLLRWLGYLLSGYNQIAIIGPLLSLVTVGLIAYFSLTKKIDNLSQLWKYCMMAFTCYLFCTTTIHPWYLIMLIFFATAIRSWWVLVWSALIILSYSTYRHPDFQQDLFLISLEYFVVFGLFYWSWSRGRLYNGPEK